MPEFLIEIDGTERDIALPSLGVQHVVNGPDILTCEVQDETGSYQPPLDGVLQCQQTDGSPGSVYFEGLIQSAEERAWTSYGTPTLTRLTAFDYSVFATFVTATITIAAGTTLEDALTELIAEYLDQYGVTLHPSQATGDPLPARAYDGQEVAAILTDFSQLTGWVWKIDADKQLRMWDPTTNAAGFNVTGDNDTYLDDIKVERFRQRYANRVIVLGGEGYNQNISDEVILPSGDLRTFYLNAPIFYFGPVVIHVLRGVTTTIETVDGYFGVDNNPWTFNLEDYSFRQRGDQALADQITIPGYSAWYPMRIVADGRGSPPEPTRDLTIRRPDLFGREAMQALADTALAASQTDLVRATYPTERVDILPGQTHTITLSERGLSGSFIATDVRLAYVTDGDTSAFRREVSAVNGAQAQAIWMDLYRRWLGEETSGATETTTGPAGTVTPGGGSPGGSDTQVQFNDSGAFGGDSGFTYDKANDIVTVAGANGGLIARGTLGGPAYGDSATGAAVVAEAALNRTIQAWKALTLADGQAMTLQQDSAGDMFLSLDDSLYISAGDFLNLSSGNDLTLETAILKSISLRPGAPWNTGTSLWTTSYGELRHLWAFRGLAHAASRLTASHTIDSDIASGSLMRSSFAFRITSAAACTLPPLSRSTVIASGRYRLLFISNINVSTADVTVTPDGSDLINGAATLVLKPGQSVVLSAVGGDSSAAWLVIASAGGVLTKLDDLDTPDDNTDLNVSTSRHGLTPKLPNDVTKFLDGTGAFTVPSAVAGGGGSVSAIDVECLRRAQQGLAVYSGCTPTEDAGGASMDVDVAAGHIRLATAVGVLVTAGSVTLATADVTNPRIDLVWVDTTGTLGKTDGTPAATPEPPSLPANSILLATVSVPANDTTIANAQITDKRTYTKLPQIIKKTADESVTSSTTLQDDDHVKFTMGASEAWVMRTLLFYRGGTTGDFKVGLTAPAGATKVWSSGGNSASVTGNSGNWTAYSGTADNHSGQSLGAMGTGGSNDTVAYLDGHVLNSTTPGSLQVQWAQATSNGTATSVLAGSYVMAWPQF